MYIRKLRAEKGLSQEQLAEASALSLRTIQRVEAGHRVGYASLRALAATFDVDVDLLERELYAMKNASDDYVEKPLWIRLLLSLPSLARLTRPAMIRHEAILVTYAIFAYLSSFIVPRVGFGFAGLTTVDALHFSAFSALLVAYIVALSIRLKDHLSMWSLTCTR